MHNLVKTFLQGPPNNEAKVYKSLIASRDKIIMSEGMDGSHIHYAVFDEYYFAQLSYILKYVELNCLKREETLWLKLSLAESHQF